ncbi:hypothetical protein OXX79_003666 [Metschnikowia pulcherrima]
MEDVSESHVSMKGVDSESAAEPPFVIGPKPDLLVTTDDALNMKLFLVNNALDEIGFTWYHAKIAVSAGLGLAADGLLEAVHNGVRKIVGRQFQVPFPVSTQVFYAGAVLGAMFWGFGADLIGRKFAFKVTLLLAAFFAVLTGCMGSYATYCVFAALSAFSAGGNLMNDLTTFLEILPSKRVWLTTLMMTWWCAGRLIGAVTSAIFVGEWSCPANEPCVSSNNRAWRYNWFICGALLFVWAIVRVCIKVHETPKFLVSNGRDDEAISVLHAIAAKYGRICTLTQVELEACGEVTNSNINQEYSGMRLMRSSLSYHKILMSTKKVKYSTLLVNLSWTMAGVTYNIFPHALIMYTNVHRLDSSGWLNIPLANWAWGSTAGLFGPVLAACLVRFTKLGLKGTMAVGALASMAFLFGFSAVTTQVQDGGLKSGTCFFLYVYLACLVAYTVQVFPAIARATGSAMCIVSMKMGGIISPVIFWYGTKAPPSTPFWLCGAVMAFLALVSMFLRFEPSHHRSV